MHRRIIATVALALTLGSANAVAAEEATPTEATSPSEPELGSVTLEVDGLVDMEGLELVGKVWGPTPARSGVEVFHLPIDKAEFSASGRMDAAPGDYYMWVFAGPPPCDASFMPVCGESFQQTEFICMTTFDVRSGEDIWVVLAGLPGKPLDERAGPPPCPVWYWGRGSAMN